MALEAALYGSRPAPQREAFRSFANDVELTLHSLAAALRGSPLKLDSLSDLREDHRAPTRSGDSQIELYALVNVETDRITNSLNTLLLRRFVGRTSRSATGLLAGFRSPRRGEEPTRTSAADQEVCPTVT